MSSTHRIAALQLRAHDRAHFEQALGLILDRIAVSAAQADLLVVPEGTFPAYVLGAAGPENAVPERVTAKLREIARVHECAIVAGCAVLDNGTLYNSALVVDRDGTIAGRADKLFLWHFDRKWFAPGERLAPVQTSIGRLGVMICADGRMPGIARSLVDAGAELLVMPTAWVTSGRDPQALENIQADLLARIRAFENHVPFIAANKCGVEEQMVAYCGKSQIVDRDGTILALAPEREEATITAEVTFGAPTPFRSAGASPAARDASYERSVRVAITPYTLPPDMNRRLETLDADVAVAPHSPEAFAAFDRLVPAVSLNARAAFDPGALIPYRIAGYRCAVLESDEPHPWLERIARARAIELRIYVIVFERDRAYAYDPDGVAVAGTFGDFRIASFPLDLRRTQHTLVAPGTDVAAGIERIATLSAQGSPA